jgi:Holliday junction resolvase RusA-like endonuclease
MTDATPIAPVSPSAFARSGGTHFAFEIPGKPFAKQRPRFSRASGRAYTPGETVSFERLVGTLAAQHIAQPLGGPVTLTVLAMFEPPPSWSKKKVEALMGRPHTQKPDLDNCLKAVLDGLNRIAFADDAQVASFVCHKTWGAPARTVVIVEAMQC